MDRLVRGLSADVGGDVLGPHRLAAQADDDDAVDVGMGAVGDEDPPRQFRVGAQLRAAVLVLDPGRPRDQLGDAPGHAVGADDGGEDEDMVADPDGPVGPSIAHDGHVIIFLAPLVRLMGWETRCGFPDRCPILYDLQEISSTG